MQQLLQYDPSVQPSGSVLVANLSDVKFLDHLQTKYSDEVGYLPLAVLERYLVQECVVLAFENGCPAGYLLGKNIYKNDLKCAIIYQAAISYDARRRYLGKALVQTFMDRLPVTTEYVVLWCAADLEANLFWEAMDFHAIAYRAGSRKTRRVHILWEGFTNDWKGNASFTLPPVGFAGSFKEMRAIRPVKSGEDWQRIPSFDALLAQLPPKDLGVSSHMGRGPVRARSPTDHGSALARFRHRFVGIGHVRLSGGQVILPQIR